MPNVFDYAGDRIIDSPDALQSQIGTPHDIAVAKVIDHIDDLAARFIAASPFVVLLTRRADGKVDSTPRSDPAGFVHVLDPKTLALPDRPGNNRVDALRNILATGNVGLLFLIPRIGATLRVMGRAAVVEDRALSERLAVNGRPAGLVTLIRVEEVMAQCPKAFIRSGLWDPDKWPDPEHVPSLAEILKAHAELPQPVQDLAEALDSAVASTLY